MCMCKGEGHLYLKYWELDLGVAVTWGRCEGCNCGKGSRVPLLMCPFRSKSFLKVYPTLLLLGEQRQPQIDFKGHFSKLCFAPINHKSFWFVSVINYNLF